MLRAVSVRSETVREPKTRRRVTEYREFKDGEDIAGTRYRVIRLIGVGGMGTVYEVEHKILGKRFVLKALLRELARREDLVQRLRNEWRALGRLEHPNIVTVTDAGTTSTGVPFYVMERLDGETLAQRMRRVRRFSIEDALRITAAILDGLSAAHEIGIVHRDVKPPNVILSAGDHPKVLDFGVAKIVDDPGVVTARGVAVGTPRYMSPEQARGERVDGRADIYSCGLLLFEMVAGVGPFDDSRDPNEMILAHIARVAPPLSSLAMGVLPDVDAVVAEMLDKRIERRPPTALDAAKRLRAVLSMLADPASGKLRLAAAGGALAIAPVSFRAPTPSVRRKDDTTRPDGQARPSSVTHTSAGMPSWSGAPYETRPVEATTFAAAPAFANTSADPTAFTSLGAVVTSIGTAGDTVADPAVDATEFGSVAGSLVPASPPNTEMLSLEPAPEAPETRTRVPIDRPPSVTPPPIAPVGWLDSPSEYAVSRGGLSRGLALGIGAVVVVVGALGLTAYGLKQRSAESASPVEALDTSVAAQPPSDRRALSSRPAQPAGTPPAHLPPRAGALGSASTAERVAAPAGSPPPATRASSPKSAAKAKELAGSDRPLTAKSPERKGKDEKRVGSHPTPPAALPKASSAPSAAPGGALPGSGL
jgi:serine/threonine protein kinase